jgi:hypothetical protein
MALVCIQCSMRALLHDEALPTFDETAEEHQRRVHPDLEATQAERRELEQALAVKMKGKLDETK